MQIPASFEGYRPEELAKSQVRQWFLIFFFLFTLFPVVYSIMAEREEPRGWFDLRQCCELIHLVPVLARSRSALQHVERQRLKPVVHVELLVAVEEREAFHRRL